jgi:hypothetical protein
VGKEQEEAIDRILKDAEAAAMSEPKERTLSRWVAEHQRRVKELEESYAYMRAVKLDVEEELATLRRDYEALEDLQKRENEINLARRKKLREQLESRERQIRELQDQRMRLLLESPKEGGG